MSTKLDEIIEAVDFVSWNGGYSDNRAYIRREDSEIFFSSDVGDFEPLPDDIDDGSRYVAVPDKRDLGLGKPLAISFAQEYLPEDVDSVYAYFSESGAYSRFKDLLQRNGLLEQWFHYEQEAIRSAVSGWCVEFNINVQARA